ncbi:hypothetical protein ACHWI2_01450, partial [Klebsiella pneumoniae]
ANNLSKLRRIKRYSTPGIRYALRPAQCPVQPENAALIILPIMFLRSHDEFSAPGLLAGKSEKPGH